MSRICELTISKYTSLLSTITLLNLPVSVTLSNNHSPLEVSKPV